MNSFPDIPNPSKITRNISWRTLTATFGDGYEQFTPDGVNTKETEYDLTWDVLNETDFNILETFLDTQTPSVAFNWTDPKKGTVETVRFVSDSFKPGDENVNYYNVTLTLKTAYGY